MGLGPVAPDFSLIYFGPSGTFFAMYYFEESLLSVSRFTLFTVSRFWANDGSIQVLVRGNKRTRNGSVAQPLSDGEDSTTCQPVNGMEG